MTSLLSPFRKFLPEDIQARIPKPVIIIPLSPEEQRERLKYQMIMKYSEELLSLHRLDRFVSIDVTTDGGHTKFFLKLEGVKQPLDVPQWQAYYWSYATHKWTCNLDWIEFMDTYTTADVVSDQYLEAIVAAYDYTPWTYKGIE